MLLRGHNTINTVNRRKGRKMTDTAAKVKQVIAETLNKDIESIDDAASFIDDLGADSLDTVEIVMALESAFDITIEDDAAENISTVGDAIAQITESIGS